MFEVQRSTKEGDVRVTTAFNRMLGFPRASVQDVAFGSEGVIVTVRLRPQAAGMLGLRHARAADQGASSQELAASGSWRVPLPCRVPAQAAVLPGLRRCVRAGAVGPGRLAVYARLRGHGGVPGAADGQDADHQADADRVAIGREDPRPRRCRQARSRPSGRAGDDRRGRGQLCLRASLPDLRRRPPAAAWCGPRRAATPRPCKGSSTS